jgi:hypothetical protein
MFRKLFLCLVTITVGGVDSFTVKPHAFGIPVSTALSSFPVESVGLNDRFDRWRFLQNLLEGDVENEVCNRVLLQVLKNSLDRKGDHLETGTAEITSELRTKLESVITSRDGPLVSYESLDELEKLIPDISEDEDAFKSSWDTVMEIHGRESVKLNEIEGSPEWKLSCLVARVLLHFDFLLTFSAQEIP